MPIRVVTSQTGGDGDQKIAAGQVVALGDRQRGRHDFRGDMGHGRAVHVAHRDRGDQIAVQQRRAGKRQMVAADHARFATLRQRRGERRDLAGLLALMAGDRAGQRIENEDSCSARGRARGDRRNAAWPRIRPMSALPRSPSLGPYVPLPRGVPPAKSSGKPPWLAIARTKPSLRPCGGHSSPTKTCPTPNR